MTVQAMGYFWVGTSKLDDWTSFASGQLGLQRVDRGGAMHAFRMDDRKQRLIVDGGLTDGELFLVGKLLTQRRSMHWRLGWKRLASRCGGKLPPWQTNVAPLRCFPSATRLVTVWRRSTAARSPTNRFGHRGI